MCRTVCQETHSASLFIVIEMEGKRSFKLWSRPLTSVWATEGGEIWFLTAVLQGPVDLRLETA